MKKKILAVALVVALVAIMVGGTLAYFTDNDEVTNTFTIGNVKIEIYENGSETDDTHMTMGILTPIANTTDPSADESYIDKLVVVKNTGANDAYIRTHIAIPTKLVDYLVLDVDTTGWTEQTSSTATVDGVEYTVYTYDYNESVAPTVPTSQLLKGVYLAADVDFEADSAGNLWFVKKTNGEITHRSNFLAHTATGDGYKSADVYVLVASQAIQSQGFDNATTALNSGFTSNPWA